MKTSLLITISFLLLFKVSFCQSSNVTIIKKWYHGPSLNAIYVNGNYAYLGSDVAFNVLDISDTSSIKVVSQIIIPQTIQWITYQSGKAYVAAGDSGLYIIDVSNALQPIESGFYQTPGKAHAVFVSGNYAYVADDTAGLRVLDVSNPASPFEVGFFDLGNTKANNVVVSGNYAYIAYGASGLQIVDVSNHSSPVSVSFLNWNAAVSTVFISGNFAYLLNDSLRIVNITNPLSPIQVSVTGSFGFYKSTLFVSGNFAYTVSDMSSEDYDIWDISNPSAPSLMGTYYVRSPNLNGQCVFVDGAQAYFLNTIGSPGNMKSLDIVNVSNPTTPSLRGKFRQAQMYVDVCSSGNYVYTIDWEPPMSALIGVYDISNSSLPRQIGTYHDSSNFFSGNLFASGNYLYLTGSKTGTGYGVKIIDISNSSNPVKVGSFNISGATAQGISVSGAYAYVCFGNQGIRVINVSNPTTPISVGSLTLSGGFEAIEIFVTGNYAYVTDNASILHIIDVSNPAALIEVGSYQLPANGSDVYASGNYAYVAAGQQGLIIIDVSNPSSPVLVGTYSSVGNSSNLKLYKVGSYVYLSDFFNGLQVIDVSNLASPVQVGYYYNISQYARNVYADNNSIYFISDYDLFIFNNSFVTNVSYPDDIKNNFLVFPNPFSTQTVIQTNSLLHNATLTVYNCYSETVAQIKNISGQTINFNRNNLPSGMYFYRLREENKTIAIDKLIITDK